MKKTEQEPLASDLLQGGAEISTFIFGDPSQRRRIYWLAEQQSLPVFRLGQLLCARKSTVKAWIESQERVGLGA
jgi:hypothetical protein